MMKLKVNGKQLALDPDQSIGIEKISPVFNDDAGSYSYSFTVPTEPNLNALGHPGRLQRAGNLPTLEFDLEEMGLRIAKGELGIDTVSRKDTSVYLKSGNTEFSKKMEGKFISDFFMGVEWWFGNFYSPAAMNNKLEEWNENNRNFMTNMSTKYTVLPLSINSINGDASNNVVNAATTASNEQVLDAPPGSTGVTKRIYCFQFSVAHLLNTIMAAAGYAVSKNEIFDSEWRRLLVYGKLFYINVNSEIGININYNADLLYLKDMVPDWEVNDFLDVVKKELCLNIAFDDIQKTVSITFKKNIFSGVVKKLKDEINDWEHQETEVMDGFSISYEGQEDDLATESDYDIAGYVTSYSSLPSGSAEYIDLIFQAGDTGRDYKCVSEGEEFLWKRIGRLKTFSMDGGENEYSIPAKVPVSVAKEGYFELPHIGFDLNASKVFNDMGILAFTLYQGPNTISNVLYYLSGSDQLSVDGTINFNRSLTPEYLYNQLYKRYIHWDTYLKRGFTKYIAISLRKVLELDWEKRYQISGVSVFFNKIKFDLPYKGVIEAEGYTA